MPQIQHIRKSVFFGRKLRLCFCISSLLWCLPGSLQAQSPDSPSEQSASPKPGSWAELNQILHSTTKGQALIGFLVGGLITYGLIRFLLSENEPGEYKPVMGTLLALLVFGFATLITLVRLLFIWP